MISVRVENITKKYGLEVAVKQINFCLKKGEIVGFLGSNGAGKSTTMKMITGCLLPSQGKIEILGKDLEKNLNWCKAKIGYLAENNPLYLDMYVREYLGFCAQIYKVGKEKIEQAIQLTGLGENANKKIETLSKGYRQRVGLAAAILHNPDILILDEPTTGLDPNQIMEIRKVIRELAKEKTILLSSHIMQEIEAMCNRVIIINKGEIVLDRQMEQLRGQNQTIEVTFDYKVEVELLRKIEAVEEVTNNYENNYTLKFKDKEDKTGKIFDFATQNGLRILQINHSHKDLEDIFMEVTKK